MNNLKTTGFIGLSLMMLGTPSCRNAEKSSENAKESKPLNILFIAVDDLRPELGCYGIQQIKSPNIDRLAESGLMFMRSYCNIPVCGASRASILTGTRPGKNDLLDYDCYISVDRPGIPTVGKWFKEHGYYTIHNSKVMHHKGDAPGSWDEEWWPNPRGTWRDYAGSENIAMDTEQNRGPAYECIDVSDETYIDGQTAAKTIQDLKKLKESGKAFFLATGFLKPHLPFTAPKKYWDLYDEKDIIMPDNIHKPKDAPDISMHNWGELRGYYGIPKTGPLTDDMAKTLKHGYYACVSYTDAQIGKVLAALDSLGMADNTAVILWGDHGWNLREHGLWCKHCNYETSLHTPLIMRVPGKATGKSNAIVEYVDVYPTLCDICGIEKPGHLEGISLEPILDDPSAPSDGIAVAKWFKGVTVIRDNYFYTEWQDSTNHTFADMLYDHSTDPGENVNVSLKEENRELVRNLRDEILQHRGSHFETLYQNAETQK